MEKQQQCHICMQDVGKAHKCKKCRKSVHIFCGIRVGEEGYGQNVICFDCSNKEVRG